MEPTCLWTHPLVGRKSTQHMCCCFFNLTSFLLVHEGIRTQITVILAHVHKTHTLLPSDSLTAGIFNYDFKCIINRQTSESLIVTNEVLVPIWKELLWSSLLTSLSSGTTIHDKKASKK